jgi:hypothetical protein
MNDKSRESSPKDSSPRSKRVRIAVPNVSDAALDLLSRADQRARERNTTIRHGFIALDPQVAEAPTEPPPLARLLRATKGGAVRLRFYLAVLWQAGGGDERHNVTWPARAWAELLDLPDPEGRGDRRIRDAIRVLESAGLLAANRRPGEPIELELRREDGTRVQYTHPGQVARDAKQAGRQVDRTDWFVQLPPVFWTRGWAIVLSGPGLAMLLVLLVLTENGSREGEWISPGQARSRFALSEDTWTRGVAELRRHGLLETRKKPVSQDFGWRRVRNTYTLRTSRLDEDPRQPPPEQPPARKSRRRTSRRVRRSVP